MIQAELRLLAASFGFGIGIIVSYGLIDLLRQFLSFSKPVRVVTELLYWSVAAMLAFQLEFRFNDGLLRLYSVLGAVGGMLLARWLTAGVFTYLAEKAKKAVRKRRIRNRKRKVALQNQLKKRWKQVRIKMNSFKKETEEES